LKLIPTRDITRTDDYSQSIEQKQVEILDLAIEDFHRRFPDASLGADTDLSYIEGKMIRLVNEADEELATYEIIINNTDVPGRVELQCTYVATEFLPTRSNNAGLEA
jgi:hypothetical protein